MSKLKYFLSLLIGFGIVICSYSFMLKGYKTRYVTGCMDGIKTTAEALGYSINDTAKLKDWCTEQSEK
jgi:hypothetical protein